MARSLGKLFWPRSHWAKAGVTVGLLGVLLIGVGWYFTRPVRLTPLAESMLAGVTHARARIGKARLTWGGELILDRVRLSVPTASKSQIGQRLFDAKRIEVTADFSQLLRANLRPQRVQVVEPTVHIIENLDTGRYNYQRLQVKSAESGQKLTYLPRIDVVRGEVRFYRARHGQVKPIGKNLFQGTLGSRQSKAGIYQLSLGSRGRSEDAQLELHGRIDLPQKRAKLRLDGFEFDSPQGTLLPQDLRQWWDQLNPEGALPAVTVTLARDQNGAISPKSAKVRVNDLALSVPYEMMVLGSTEIQGQGESQPAGDSAPKPPVTRMTDVTGTFEYRDGRVYVPGVSGVIEGIRYHLKGEHGLTAEEPFKIAVRTEAFDLPEHPDFYPAVPRVVRKFYRMFKPSGRFQTQWTIRRPSEHAAIEIAGAVKLIQAKATYSRFPYPCRAITGGVIKFTDDRVEVEHLVAYGPSGARLELNGTVAPLGREARVHFTAEVADLPIDRHLLGAMEPKYRRIMALFFDQAGYQKLLRRGLVREPSPRLGPLMAELNWVDRPPAFEPGGTIDAMRLVIHRPPGPKQNYQITVGFDAAGLDVLFAPWPYPATTSGGRITLGPDRIAVERLDLRGLTGGKARIAGHIERGGKFGPDPNLRIKHARLPIDRMLIASLPSPQAQWVHKLHLGGQLQAQGRVYRPDASGPQTQSAPPINFKINAELAHGSIASFDKRYRLSELNGQATLQRKRLTLHQIRGRRNQSEFKLRGQLGWQNDHPRVDLELEANPLTIEPAIIDLAPPQTALRRRLRSFFQTYQPRGELELKARLASDSLGHSREAGHPEMPGNGLVQPRNPRPRGNNGAGIAGFSPPPNPKAQAPNRAPVEELGGLNLALTTRPDHLSALWDGQRIYLKNISGIARLSPQHLELEQLRGNFTSTGEVRNPVPDPRKADGEAKGESEGKRDPPTQDGSNPGQNRATPRVSLDGVVGLSKSPAHALTIRASAPTIGPVPRNILPDAVEGAIDRLGLEGHWKLTNSRLRYRSQVDGQAGGGPSFDFDGRLSIEQGTANVGLPVTDLDAQLAVRAIQTPNKPRARLKLKLKAKKLRVAHRLISPLRATLTSPGEDAALRIRQLRGSTYFGSLVGRGKVRLGNPGAYRFHLTLQDALLEPIISPQTAKQHGRLRSLMPIGTDDQGLPLLPKPVDGPDGAGLISAGIRMQSQIGKPDQRRGRGSVLIKNAKLVQRPFSLAMLQAINLSLPQSSSFDAVAARFLIHGQSLWFDTLAFQAPSVHVTGSGTMQLPSTRLNMTMFNRNPGSWMWAPMRELYNTLKDQMMAVKITGTLFKPQTSLVAFENIRRSWSALFSARHAKRGMSHRPIIDSDQP